MSASVAEEGAVVVGGMDVGGAEAAEGAVAVGGSDEAMGGAEVDVGSEPGLVVSDSPFLGDFVLTVGNKLVGRMGVGRVLAVGLAVALVLTLAFIFAMG